MESPTFRPSYASATLFDTTQDDTGVFSLVAPASGFGAGAASVGADCVGAGSGLAMALYLTETGTSFAISTSDLYHGQIGDCFLIFSIGEIALER